MRLIRLVFLLYFFTSCSKEKTFHIIAKNAVTGQGYSGLSYRIFEERQGSFESKSKKIEEGTLNDDGEKLIAVKMKKNRNYKVLVDLPVNTCYHNELSYYYSLTDEKSPRFEFEFAACGFLKLDIENTNCSGENDLMYFRTRYSYADWQSFSSDRKGCYSYQSPDYFQVPEGWRVYNWVVYRNGLKTEFMDSVFVKKDEFSTFVMNY